MLKIFRWSLVLAACAVCGCDSVTEGGAAAVDPNAPVSVQIEQFTGAATKAVWTQSQDSKKPDTYVNNKSHYLMGLDSRDGKGVRVILKEKSNYARPLITPGGERIVYSYKDVKKAGKGKYFDVTMYQVDWDGTNIVKLGKGYAVDVWRDPKTEVDWVYAATGFQPKTTASIFAKKIVRFPLNDPEKIELVWDQTVVTPDNFQLSADGLRACGLFPWPSAGAVDFTKGEWNKYFRGCWPSCAPDNSYVTWVFEGGHKVLHFFTNGGKKTWEVDVSQVPGIDGHELYHPRWSNHVRFFAFTGPYKEGDPGENKISAGGKDADFFIGRFNERLNKVENVLRITNNSGLGDFFPDLWVEPKGGKVSSVNRSKVGPGAEVAAPEVRRETVEWPSNADGLVFLWENLQKKNEIPLGDARAICAVEPKGRARYFRHQEMHSGGGEFLVDDGSEGRIAEVLKGGADVSVEVLVNSDGKQDAAVLRFPGVSLYQRGVQLVLAVGGVIAGESPAGELRPGEPVHAGLSRTGGAWQLWVDGKPATGKASESAAADGAERLVFGGKWEGKLMGVGIYARAFEAGECGAHRSYWAEQIGAREEVPALEVRGRLVEMTPTPSVESLDTYRRALAAYTYEIDEVVSGECDARRLQVMHWVIMDNQVLEAFPREIGTSYTLKLEPFKAHPQLISERQFNASVEFDLDLYYDIASPAS